MRKERLTTQISPHGSNTSAVLRAFDRDDGSVGEFPRRGPLDVYVVDVADAEGCWVGFALSRGLKSESRRDTSGLSVLLKEGERERVLTVM